MAARWGGDHGETATTVEVFEKRAADCGSFERVGSRSDFVKEHERRRVSLFEQASGRGHGARKGRQIGPHILLVTDVAPDVFEVRNHGARFSREWNSARAHQDHHPDRLEHHRLPTRIGT